MHFTKFAVAASLIAASTVSFAQAPAKPDAAVRAAAPSAPVPAAANAEALQMAGGFGFAMGAMPEMQRRCGHTADQKRRVSRVIGYLESQMTQRGGAVMANAFREGLTAGAQQVVQLASSAAPAQMKTACSQMDADFEPKLQAAEQGIPADFMPATKVGPAVKPAAAAKK